MSEGLSSADVIDILISDHRDVTALIGEIKSVTDPMIRRDLTDTAISEVVRHAVAEEMYVYPAMRGYLADDNAVQHDIEEHKALERTMKQLEAVDVSSAEFDDAIARLEMLLADHVQDGDRTVPRASPPCTARRTGAAGSQG